ncbi:hypothetical protein GQ53DRAFT_716029 [Thozetella sp. PMI_491]|nr:hypothetical protein GQ53DRAFT_716029 [Thozetella sp. PMI_491]
MAASRRGQPPLSVNLPQPASTAQLPDLPPISALFLIDFDVKAGYTIVWKQALAGLELEGVVEYKSLPSGLHTVSEDLIYFVHDGAHAGLSAFLNTKTDDEATRHARMIAVGILVPLSYGRLGRAWRHAERLKEMTAQLATDQTQTSILEQYWEKNKARDTTAAQPLKDTPLSSPFVSFNITPPRKGHFRNRSASDGGALIAPGHRLSPFHPAWSLSTLLDTFGPLIFPIHRAALLRKRILISTHAPVREACNFVYDISILSNIPSAVLDIIEPSVSAPRLRPLFTIGVHDLADLLQPPQPNGQSSEEGTADDAGAGWVACTTDSILAVKENLWDMLITMPPTYSTNAAEKIWPIVECPKGVPVKATQRDLRRYRSLKHGLTRLAAISSAAGPHTPRSTQTSETAGPSSSGIRLSTSRPGTSGEDPPSRANAFVNDGDADKIVEPTTWAALAYSGFLWWASAGEQRRGDEVEESAHDATLLADLAPPMLTPHRRASFGGLSTSGLLADSVASLTARAGDGDEEEEQARVELAIIAYFHRLTTGLLSVLADVVDSSDEDDLIDIDVDAEATTDEDEDDDAGLLRRGDQEDGSGWVRVGSDALSHMGLDVWSKSDADFVRELTERYFARRAYVEMKGVEVCGLRVC